MHLNDEKRFKLVCYILMGILALTVVFPFWLLISGSLMSEADIMKEGYRFLPPKITMDAYSYLVSNASMILQAYGVTLFVTVLGTVISVVLTCLTAWPLSRRNFPARKLVNGMLIVTMLFSGGMVPTYLIYSMVFGIKNTIWALIFPNLLMSTFNIILVRTYYMTSIPEALLEAAYMDGATELQTFLRIAVPLSKPIIATIGLMVAINYWNDWTNSLYFITKPELYSIQAMLNRIVSDIQYLKSNTQTLGTAAAASLTSLPSQSIRMAIAFVGALPLLVAYPFFQKYFIKGITIGSVKG